MPAGGSCYRGSMPEGDTLYNLAAGLRPDLVGHPLERVWVRDRGELRGLSGRRVLGVDARGKHLLVRLEDDVVLRTHLGLKGVWHRYRRDERWGRSRSGATVVLETARQTFVCFRASQVAVTLSKRPDAADPDVHPPASRVGKGDGSSPWWLETHQRSRDDLARSVQRLEALRSRLQDLEADLQQRRESIEQSLDDLQDVANKMREDAEALDRHAAALSSDAEEGIQDIEKHGEYRVIKSRTVIRSGDLKLLIDKDDRVQAFRDGKVIYEGPKDPEDGAEPLPDEVRRLLDGFLKIESRIVPANESAP